MAAVDLRNLPPWALYGGAGLAAGGGYLLYKKHKAAAAPAAPSLNTQTIPSVDSSAQQSSVVPYYLTAGTGDTSGTGMASGGRWPPRTTGASVPAATGTGVLPDIPPLLPIASTPPPAVTPTPTPVAPTPAPPPPAPAPQQNNIPADLMAKITAAGEQIIGSAPAPNGGVWYLGSKGGVFAINAPFYGAPSGQSYWTNFLHTPVQIQPQPNGGYTVVTSAGERFNYGP